jgi:hypothetical protein
VFGCVFTDKIHPKMARGMSSRSRNTSPAPRSGRSAPSASQGRRSEGGRRRRDLDEEEDDMEMNEMDDPSQDGHDVRSELCLFLC